MGRKKLLDLDNKALVLLVKKLMLNLKLEGNPSRQGTPRTLQKEKCPQLTGQIRLNGNVAHLQKEWYWIIALVLFFLERDVLTDTLLLILGIIYNATR